MDLGEDFYASPAPQVGPSLVKKRTPTIRSTWKPPTLKGKNSDPRLNTRPLPRRANATNVEATVPDWTVRNMVGKCPPFDSDLNWIHDPSNRRLFAYGGLPPDGKEIPTSDFYVCDLTTMEWKNVTNSLKYRDPYDPFSQDERHRMPTPLPPLTEPGCTMLSIGNSSYVFIFGGYDIEAGTASSKIIVLDPEHLEWWYLRLEGEGVEARIDPAVASIGAKLYIFGGYKQLGDDPQPCYSYSVAEFLHDRRLWQWTVRDQLYSNIIPPGHLFGVAIPVYNGAKLLLTPGRVSSNRIQFKEDNLFFYHVAKNKFQLVDIAGDFPTDVMGYSIHKYQMGLPELPTTSTSSRVETLGRSRKVPSKPHDASSALGLIPQATASVPLSPSFIICAWIPMPERPGDATPDLWQLFLTPDERIDHLNVAQQVCKLNHDFQWFVCVDERMRLMGYDDGRMDTGEEGDIEMETDPDAKWNIFLDIPLPNRK